MSQSPLALPRADTACDQSVRDLATAAVDALPPSLCVLDERGEIVLVNAAWRGFAAESGAEAPRPGTGTEGARYLDACDAAALTGDRDAGRFAEGLRAVLDRRSDRYMEEYPCATPRGVRWFVGRVKAFDAQGRRWVVVLHDDVTDLKLTEAALARANGELEDRARQRAEELRLSEQRYEIVARASHEGLFDWAAGRPAYVSARFLEILGLGEAGSGGFWWLQRLHPDDADRVCSVLSHPLTVGGPIAVECRLRRGDGSYVWCDLRGYAVSDRVLGRVGRVVGTLTDITHHKSAQADLVGGATRDGLTGLPNRAVFMDRLAQALDIQCQDGRAPFALVLIDLDRFGVLNRHFGADVGDALLLEAARRIAAAAPANSVARIGGDEFAVLLRSTAGGGDAGLEGEALAARVAGAIATPFAVAQTACKLTASIGIVPVTATGRRDAAALLADADLAMLAARERGGGHWQVFEPAQRTRARRSFEIADALRDAVEGRDKPDGFTLAYQPVVDLASGGIAGFEALMRWTHPQLGPLPPADFIPVAESTGLIVPLGAWAIRRGCERLRRWRGRGAVPFVSVNVSARQLFEPGFEQTVRSALAATGAPPHHLKLEVTESAILDNALRAASVLAAVQALGVRVAIDDFGTGFSCLSYLSRFRFDDLKIDASFVREMTANDRALAVVRSIVELGRGLGMAVIAEGAEAMDEVRALHHLGCPLVQGYVFSRPLAEADAEALLAGSGFAARLRAPPAPAPPHSAALAPACSPHSRA